MSDWTDIQADLNELAMSVRNLHVCMGSNITRADLKLMASLADQIETVLDDRDLPEPAPLTSEIIAHLKAGGWVQAWAAGRGWVRDMTDIETWQRVRDKCGNARQYGYRLNPIPAPSTTRVRLDQLCNDDWTEYRLPHESRNIASVARFRSGNGWVYSVGDGWKPLTVDADGMVEVLAPKDDQ